MENDQKSDLAAGDIEKERKELLDKIKQANGKTIGELDSANLLKNPKDKGRIGQVIQLYLGKKPNSLSEADFPEARLELKVTGLVKNGKDGFRAKERLKLETINYVKDHGIPFERSHLLEKCESLLVSCYEYVKPADGSLPDYSSFKLIDSFIYDMSPEDKKIIQQDYDRIMEKINSGHAETISESDTQYLAACTSGQSSKNRVRQYNSEILAKPRAFSFKPSFLTTIVNEYIEGERLQKLGLGKEPEKSIVQRVIDELKPYIGSTTADFRRMFPNIGKQKNLYAAFLSNIVGVKNLQNTEEFKKAHILFKVVRKQKNGHVKESMSFHQIDFIEVSSTPWEDSSVREFFLGAKLLLPVFEETGNQENGETQYRLKGIRSYDIPDDLVDTFVKQAYEHTQTILNSGKVVASIEPDGTIRNRFIKNSENPVCHVRPKAINRADMAPLPHPDPIFGARFTKQCFWFGHSFIESIIDNNVESFLENAKMMLGLQEAKTKNNSSGN